MRGWTFTVFLVDALLVGAFLVGGGTFTVFLVDALLVVAFDGLIPPVPLGGVLHEDFLILPLGAVATLSIEDGRFLTAAVLLFGISTPLIHQASS